MSEADEERAEYNAIVVGFDNCATVRSHPQKGELVSHLHSAAANFDHADGEPITVVTIGRRTGIEALAFTLNDTRTLVTKLLVALATNRDEFAMKVLDEIFPADDEGDFFWPK